jgi:hypothetical protein
MIIIRNRAIQMGRVSSFLYRNSEGDFFSYLFKWGQSRCSPQKLNTGGRKALYLVTLPL